MTRNLNPWPSLPDGRRTPPPASVWIVGQARSVASSATHSASCSLRRIPMHPNAELIKRFYTAFQKRDAAGMIACYHPDVVFSDAVFTDLRGWRAGAMWKMLAERGKDLQLEFSQVQADDKAGSAHWDAR